MTSISIKDEQTGKAKHNYPSLMTQSSYNELKQILLQDIFDKFSLIRGYPLITLAN